MQLEFPILFYFWGRLSVWKERDLGVLSIRFLDDSRMICIAHAKANFVEPAAWVLEKNGRFRELVKTGERNSWARFLSPVVQFVRSVYEVGPPRIVEVRELQERLVGIKDKANGPPIAKDLRRFLEKLPKDQVVTAGILADWPL